MFELRKIGIVKRASAWLLDAILLAVVITGFMFVLSLICNYSEQEKLSTQYYNEWEDYRKDYVGGEGGVAEHYGYTYTESENGYTLTKNGESASLEDVIGALENDASRDESPEMTEAYAKYKALTPVRTVNLQYRYVYNLLFMMVSLGTLLGYLLMEFIIPIILKNGQTVGKKMFGIGLVRPDCVKITNLSLFARTIVGKFAIETMFPVFLVFLFFFGGLGLLAIILFAAILLLNVILFFATANRTPIHDLLAGTVVIDLKLQMIYASVEELTERKALEKKESVENSKS